MTTSTDRKRRSPGEVKQLIANAASAEFVENGFERTTIRSVARRAGATESMVFRHFESKAELFRSTAAAPLVSFMDDFASTLGDDTRHDPHDVTLCFARGLYELCSTNRHILVSLAAGTDDDRATAEASPLTCLQALIDGVHRYMAGNGRRPPAICGRPSDSRLPWLAGEALFPPGIGETEIGSALAQFILFGAGYAPAAAADGR
ncbi:TetR/AcrR family transcriptional regulator [Nocardia sp. NBC_00881]|uniref:TetR/AcrR family transcriptional regulator n=1 Tax=Nocardia sp. NBC_00881 TaxID=2975995 RepID=UPI00386DA697|nr:TetR/AcrR family transcriptional regulator [Nocardia sp. NBC_00881]